MNDDLLKERVRKVVGRKHDEAAVDGLVRAILRAREDPEEFTELVMRTEHGNREIKLAAHQRIGMHFMLHHPRSVNIYPINHTKTFSTVALTLYMIGRDPTTRGAIVSATQQQASKIIRMVSDYIDNSPLYKLIFEIERGEKWTDTVIIVKRPPGIKDPTLVAYGIDTQSIQGTRVDWAICDDILNGENTRTKEGRDKVDGQLVSAVESRIEPNGQIILTNSAWHPEDALHRRMERGWATLRMQVDGHIYVKDDIMTKSAGRKPWDHPSVYSVDSNDDSKFGERLRIKAPGHDASTSLWPEVFGPGYLEKLKERFPITMEFNRLWMSVCRDDESAMCKSEWIEKCKAAARARGIFGMVQRRTGSQNTYTGVDLAVSQNEGSDDCAIFTIEILPSGHRQILDVQVGKFDGPTMVKKLIDVHNRYDSVVRVENNASQDLLLHFMRDQAVHVPIRPHTTGRNKAHAEHGVLSIFTEMANGAWLIPNDKEGNCHPAVQKFIDGCLYYTPAKHTSDLLMSCWFAREQAREFGALSGRDTLRNPDEPIALNLMAR